MEKENRVAKFHIDEINEGDTYSFDIRITKSDICKFSGLSQDISPLHLDEEFARKRGFKGQVAHGVLVLAMFSRMVGVHLPGENALLQSINVRFKNPVYSDDELRIGAIVDQVSKANRVIVLKIEAIITNSGKAAAKGKLQIGFTENIDV
jgi:3-hydroxybutyryl-CoA dehydratase